MSNTGSLLVLDAHPDGIIYRELVPEYVDVVRTIYEGTIHTNTHFHVCIYTVCMYMAYVYLCVCPVEDHNKYTSTLYVYVCTYMYFENYMISLNASKYFPYPTFCIKRLPMDIFMTCRMEGFVCLT